MSSSLDDVFHKILLSEQKANERKTLINQARSEIQKYEKDILKTGSNLDVLSDNIATKVQTWNETDLMLKCLVSKEKILQEQKVKLCLEHQQLKEEMKREKSESEINNHDFREKINHFMNGYDFISDGKRKREEQAKIHIKAAKENALKLGEELENVGKHQDRIETLEKTKNELDIEMIEATKYLTELEVKLEEEDRKLVSLMQERESIMNQPQCDPEFLSLQAELESSRTDNLEEICVALQLELQELQQLQWQKQVQKRKNERPSKKFGFKRTKSGENINPYQHDDNTPRLTGRRQAIVSPSQTKPNLARLTAAISQPEAGDSSLSSHP